MTELQEKAIDCARKELKKYKWFNGVCLDSIPSDDEIKNDFEGAVDQIIMETAYWDAPNFFNLEDSLGQN